MKSSGQRHGFTLIELLAVIAIIAILSGLVLSVAKYAIRQTSITRAKAQMAAIETALEAYKSDMGYYPASTIMRFSGTGNAELSNSAALYRALMQPNPYYKANQLDIGIGSIMNVTTNQVSVPIFPVSYFKDPWGNPWNYYRPVPAQVYSFYASINVANPPPLTSLWVTNIGGAWPVGPFQASYALGGQMNPNSFDLFSFGPDSCTYIPGANSVSYGWRWYSDQILPQHANDDIVNWGPR